MTPPPMAGNRLATLILGGRMELKTAMCKKKHQKVWPAFYSILFTTRSSCLIFHQYVSISCFDLAVAKQSRDVPHPQFFGGFMGIHGSHK